MKKIVIEVSDELYDRYLGQCEEDTTKLTEEDAQRDLSLIAEAFLSGELLEE